MKGLWTLPELTAAAASVLAQGRPPQVNGRVRDLPNERMVRWYVTIGIVDPPVSRRGRLALYGPRHLLQIVAVKRRQAAGHSIAEIQAELAGATDETLREIARVRAGDHDAPGVPPDPPGPPRRFWAERPAATRTDTSGETATATTDTPGAADPATTDTATADAARLLVHGVRLAPGATLVLDSPLSPDDATAILAAAGPLLDVLTERGLR